MIKAICWIKNLKENPLFVLVKGNLQGAVKNPKKSCNIKNKLSICKSSFLESFKFILNKTTTQTTIDKIDYENLNYLKAKNLSTDFKLSTEKFYSIYKGWIRTDPNKYYVFK